MNKYSRLLQEYFNDLSDAIYQCEGEVYQFVGDEVTIVWPIGKRNDRCIECFHLVKKLIGDKAGHYQHTYGVVPQFKAGAHVGKVVANEVGKSKKSLVYHGDVVNTTSRIIGMCRTLNQPFLVSEALLKLIGPEHIQVLEQGDFILKGKSEQVQLFGVVPQQLAP